MNHTMKFWLVATAVVAGLTSTAPAWGEAAVGYESMPFQTGGSAPASVVDVWSFACVAGGSATVSVDTLQPVEGITSPLDPLLAVFDASGVNIAEGDDENTCSFAPECGFDCPAATFNCPGDEIMTVVTWTGRSSGCATTDGGYRIDVELFDDIDGTGNPLTAADAKLGGKETSRVFPWGKLAPGPAYDDVMVPNLGVIEPYTGSAALSGSPSPGLDLRLNLDQDLKLIRPR